MRPTQRPSHSTSPIMITPFRSLRRRSANRSVLLALTGAGLFLASLDAYVVVTALLQMLTSVHIAVNRPEQATPIITGFLLGYLAVMPIAGGLSDRFGRLRLFGACLVLFAFGSLLTAAAPWCRRCWRWRPTSIPPATAVPSLARLVPCRRSAACSARCGAA